MTGQRVLLSLSLRREQCAAVPKLFPPSRECNSLGFLSLSLSLSSPFSSLTGTYCATNACLSPHPSYLYKRGSSKSSKAALARARHLSPCQRRSPPESMVAAFSYLSCTCLLFFSNRSLCLIAATRAAWLLSGCRRCWELLLLLLHMLRLKCTRARPFAG